ncbi:hypothetical protein C3Y94_028520 (plasmid) [Rhizobium ruizarguesonis]|uniref:hypothetical protein n=1 Tax=Rhizobium ruizarguesonis TaxID=2081791 RepID=UPI00163B4854|nr:hypothetical protein [Rhizobium ruizarguesonis]MBC2807069.1 hypothetical protein [Rhizobium ruizarguesonis]
MPLDEKKMDKFVINIPSNSLSKEEVQGLQNDIVKAAASRVAKIPVSIDFGQFQQWQQSA